MKTNFFTSFTAVHFQGGWLTKNFRTFMEADEHQVYCSMIVSMNDPEYEVLADLVFTSKGRETARVPVSISTGSSGGNFAFSQDEDPVIFAAPNSQSFVSGRDVMLIKTYLGPVYCLPRTVQATADKIEVVIKKTSVGATSDLQIIVALQSIAKQ